MRTLKAAGKSIVFITHKLKEVQAIADRITVIRRGRTVGTAAPDTSEEELASLMVGRSVLLRVDKDAAEAGAPVLEVAGLAVNDDRGHRAVDGVDLTVHAGEVLGIAGVQGNGQTELVEAIMGLRPVVAGSTTHRGPPDAGTLDPRDPPGRRRLRARGPQRRRPGQGLHGRGEPGARHLQHRALRHPLGDPPGRDRRVGADRVEQFDVRTDASGQAAVGTLSGGNQQKVIVAREFSRPLKLFIAAQPTRGVDVGSIEFIHRQIVHERTEGTAVLLVSSELDEVLALSDRIAVMYRGRVIAVVSPDTPREEIGLLMAGVTTDGAGTAKDGHSDD